jgi:ribosomal protein S18 acetylase RimI-like enzyme
MINSDLHIVKLSPAEWEKYKTLRLNALQSNPIAFQDTYEKAYLHPDTFWQERLANQACIWLFAESNTTIVGMMGAMPDKEHPQKIMNIVGVFVASTHRNMGISKKLMTTLLKEIEKRESVEIVRLWVAETQVAARKLYENAGFKYVGKEKELIAHNGKLYEELIMEKNIR